MSTIVHQIMAAAIGFPDRIDAEIMGTTIMISSPRRGEPPHRSPQAGWTKGQDRGEFTTQVIQERWVLIYKLELLFQFDHVTCNSIYFICVHYLKLYFPRYLISCTIFSQMNTSERTEPEFGSVQAWGSKKNNLSHLLNFHFEPRETQSSGRGGSSWKSGKGRGTRPRCPRYNKENFLQAK